LGNAPAGAEYTWDFSGAAIISGSGQGPYVISWPSSGTYSLSLFVKQDLCASDTTPESVTVKTCELVIPNVITPNGDSKNDVFKIIGLDVYPQSELVIFNRWGKLVYKNSDYLNDWNGGDSPDGVYYYILTLKDDSKYHGTVTIFR
jgi:gliding motility-associated-like protein